MSLKATINQIIDLDTTLFRIFLDFEYLMSNDTRNVIATHLEELEQLWNELWDEVDGIQRAIQKKHCDEQTT